MAQAAFKAAQSLLRDFGEVESLKVSTKGAADFVSAADRQAERLLYNTLHKYYPSYGFLMEESGARPGEDPEMSFFIDPLDGTLNFLNGWPHFAISIALCKQGQPVASVVLDPVRDEIFWASKSLGAFLGKQKLRLKNRTTKTTFLMGLGSRCALSMPSQDDISIRVTGSAVLDMAYVAAGRLDGFLAKGLGAWDCAAGALLIQEAQGCVKIQKSTNSEKLDAWAAHPSYQKDVLELFEKLSP